MRALYLTISWPGAVTSWNLVATEWRLQEVSGANQDIVHQHAIFTQKEDACQLTFKH